MLVPMKEALVLAIGAWVERGLLLPLELLPLSPAARVEPALAGAGSVASSPSLSSVSVMSSKAVLLKLLLFEFYWMIWSTLSLVPLISCPLSLFIAAVACWGARNLTIRVLRLVRSEATYPSCKNL